MHCPLCQSSMVTKHETLGRKWFAGTYRCERHGLMRVSGRILDDGVPRVTHWLPSCQEHGFVSIIQTNHDRFRCLACDEEIRVVGGRLVHLKPVRLVGGRRFLAVV